MGYVDSDNIEEKLQKIVEEHLVDTRYTADDKEDFQKDQVEKVENALKELCSDPDINNEVERILNEKITFIPTSIENEKVHNIGSSAELCLSYLEGRKDKEAILFTFLKQVKAQAQKESENRVEIAEEDYNIPQELRNYINLYVEKRILECVDDSFRDLSSRTKTVEEQLTSSKITLGETKDDLDKFSKELDGIEVSIETKLKDASTKLNNANIKLVKSEKFFKDTRKKMNKLVMETNDKVKQVEKNIDGMIPNMLTVLGIFVAIIIAVVACYLSILLTHESLKQYAASRPFEYMQYLMMCHVMFGIIFFLLYLISKLSTYELSCHCNLYELISHEDEERIADDSGAKFIVSDCSKCKKKCSIFVRLKLRYPYIFFINLAFLLAYFMLALWQIVNIYYRDYFDNFVYKHPILAGVFFVVIVVTFFERIFKLFGAKSNKQLSKRLAKLLKRCLHILKRLFEHLKRFLHILKQPFELLKRFLHKR